jgi:4-alpha-glucanotransferase
LKQNESQMRFERSSGILLHPSSLPGNYGIGDLGPAAFDFIDFLKESGCKLWQVLPLGPTGYGDSPYQCFSVFAGNPYLISPELLLQERLLQSNDLIEQNHLPLDHVDYGQLIPWKLNLLERAFNHFMNSTFPKPIGFDDFCEEKRGWLDDYSLFMAIKESKGWGSWEEWPESIRQRQPKAMEAARQDLNLVILRHKFYQYLFFQQWKSLRDYATRSNLKIIGDIPLFAAYDSADVWSHPELFKLNQAGKPTVVAGVPPDYFSSTGQLWGNPVYDWNAHRDHGFRWWSDRIKGMLELVDVVRLDHFRGFAGYWEIPASNSTAEFGKWEPGPGVDFFKIIQKSLQLQAGFPFIAEDLGLITPNVIKLRDLFEFPGMKILQFAFSEPNNSFLPHHFIKNCVVYTGTHDNNTTLGWFKSAPEIEKQFAKEYLDTDGKDISWDLIRAGWASVADLAIAPMQDILCSDEKARMNYPSRLGGNWEWRLPVKWDGEGLKKRLKKLNELYSR